MPITTTATDERALSSLVQVQRRFLRSVNLERDFYTADPLDGYVRTRTALSTLERLAAGVHQPSARAWSITGAYGTGKSAFALLAAKALAAPPVGDAPLRAALCAELPALKPALFPHDNTGFWPVLITGTREPIVKALLRGLRQAVNHLPTEPVRQAVLGDLNATWEGLWVAEGTSARDIAVVYENASRAVRRHVEGGMGLLVVIDEMGKFLEYAALHPQQGDLQVLQEMAEQAARSRESPVLLVTILHQAFEEYAHRLGPTQRAEWQKVQGRFADIPYGNSSEETLRLLAQAITPQNNAALDLYLSGPVREMEETCRRLRLAPPASSAAEFGDLLRRIYPLHPVTALILPHLFQRFGQSERSLFSFLSSEEPGGFQAFLRTHALTPEQTEPPLLRPDVLYDYVMQTLGPSLYAHPSAKLWGETEQALHRLRDNPSPLKSRLVKTIGLLHILGEQTRVLPSRPVLAFALGEDARAVDAALDALEGETLITFRQFKQAFRPYEGSDVDIEARRREARAHLAAATNSVALAQQLQATAPLVARRHSYETGTLRFFTVRCCRPDTFADEVHAGRKDADGLLLLCLATDATEVSAVAQAAQTLLASRPEIVVGVATETHVLHEAGAEVESLLWVQQNTPELRNDRVATREVHERLLDATNAFRAEWERLMHPSHAADATETTGGSAWFHLGAAAPLRSYRQLQALLSHACDQTYPYTPRLRNELINRRALSSQAAAARRNLIEGLIERRQEARLGIQGFPPESSMYASVLHAPGIHRPTGSETKRSFVGEGGRHGLFAPDADKDPGLWQVWRAVETFLFGGTLEPKPLGELNALLHAPPFGLMDGLVPVLLCAVVLCHENEVVVYEEGRFVTDLDAATWERMIKRPEDYRLQGCRVAGEREAVLARFAAGLLKSEVEPTLVNVVRALYRQFSRLPEYTLKTHKLSPEAHALRDVFKEGREPEQLLFAHLPQVPGQGQSPYPLCHAERRRPGRDAGRNLRPAQRSRLPDASHILPRSLRQSPDVPPVEQQGIRP